jgi:hypothetical protein
MVKPAGLYLDIIREVRNATNGRWRPTRFPGEYAQIHAAARLGWLDLARCRDESLLAIKRAGADMILTYFAKDVARALRGVIFASCALNWPLQKCQTKLNGIKATGIWYYSEARKPGMVLGF